ncbi:hypothetical protein MXD62_19535 [Frankia sp. Mgl5]|uniref:hypothetical protein n=1 Tax=Frankia sp. Mgl5 TaxID=2933793 RepID=UPI00200BC4AF|nr:hypothetical protein [Frankia sp. Mgl5]MCK9929345.1 hypothetical protein [Frankia sp. Mgl5]
MREHLVEIYRQTLTAALATGGRRYDWEAARDTVVVMTDEQLIRLIGMAGELYQLAA